MRRLFFVLGSVVVATACGGGGGGGGTAPSPVATSAPGWTGEATYSFKAIPEGGSVTETRAGIVKWIRDPDPEIPPLGGDVSYKLESGSLPVTVSVVANGCSGQKSTTIKLKPEDGYLIVTPSGSYAGRLKPTGAFSIKIKCKSGSKEITWDAASGGYLDIAGQLVDLRMVGDMAPPITSGVTITGHWDFGVPAAPM